MRLTYLSDIIKTVIQMIITNCFNWLVNPSHYLAVVVGCHQSVPDGNLVGGFS